MCGHIFLYITDSNSRLQLLKVSDKTQIMFLVVKCVKKSRHNKGHQMATVTRPTTPLQSRCSSVSSQYISVSGVSDPCTSFITQTILMYNVSSAYI